MYPGAVKETVVDYQVRGRADQPDSVARGIDDAIGNQGIVPIASGNRVVSCEKLTADDADVPAGVVRCSTEMHAVPAAGNFDIANFHLVAGFEQDGIVGRILERNVTNGDLPAIDEHKGVRAAHVLLTGRIEDLVAIDYALSGNCYIFKPLTENQRPVPLAPLGFRHEFGNYRLLILVEVRRPNKHRARFEKKRNMALEMNRAGQVLAGRQQDLPAAGRRACLDSLVYGGRLERRAVAYGPILPDVEHAGRAGESWLGSHEKK
jgi:hypothetical protein